MHRTERPEHEKIVWLNKFVNCPDCKITMQFFRHGDSEMCMHPGEPEGEADLFSALDCCSSAHDIFFESNFSAADFFRIQNVPNELGLPYELY